MKRITLFSALVAASLLAASTALACDGDKGETMAAAEAPADAVLTTLVIEDASCGSCVVPIREQVMALSGVLEVNGSDEDYKLVHVSHTKGKVTGDQLIDAVKKAGYKASIKSDDSAKKS